MELKRIDHISYRRLIFSVKEYFLSPGPATDADITYFIQSPENTNNALTDFYTLLINLGDPEEKIREGIYHRTRNEINSFLNNQQFEHKILFHLTSKELSEFIRLFNVFAKEKKIRKAETRRLAAYNRNGILAVSYIKLDSEPVCINFYRVTKERATNIHSFVIRENAANSSQLGRAHRALHWLDILAFKKMGAAYYDLCGWYHGNTDKDLLNINKFKEQFSSCKIKEYSGVIYKNKLLIQLLKLFK